MADLVANYRIISHRVFGYASPDSYVGYQYYVARVNRTHDGTWVERYEPEAIVRYEFGPEQVIT